MDALLSRYRNLTVLLIVIIGQLVYLAYQVKTNRDERLIRVWAVTAVTPMAGIVEGIRRNTIGFLQDYFILLDVREQNRKLKSDNDHLRMENVYFRNQLATAEHTAALTVFQKQIPSRTVPARVIGNSTVVSAKAVFVDRGSASGIEKGMAVVTPEGIVGKVVAVYPLVSQVLLVTDPTFKVGIESQKGHVHGVLNCGTGKCQVEQIQNEEQVDNGEWFFTSGEDRIFPKGFPVGVVTSIQNGQGMKDVHLSLSGAPGGAEEVLVVLNGVHRAIPKEPPQQTAYNTLPPPSDKAKTANEKPEVTPAVRPQTEADKILQRYQEVGKEQNHQFGAVGSSIPNFQPAPSVTTPAGSSSPGSTPAITPGSTAQPTTAASPAPPAKTGVLGSRPGATKPSQPVLVPQAQPNSLPRPVLPLGASRPHTPPSGTTTPVDPGVKPPPQ